MIDQNTGVQYRWVADRNYAVGYGRSPKLFRAGLIANAILIAACWFYSGGTTVSVKCNVPEAFVGIDGSQLGSIVATNVPYGVRNIQARHGSYFPVDMQHDVGWFTGHSVQLSLQPKPIRLVVQTEPGASVELDGQILGTADPRGVFLKEPVLPGKHTLKASLSGYDSAEANIEFTPPVFHWNLGLRISREHAQQLERDREESAALVVRSRDLFGKRQYHDALAAAERSLKLNSNNFEAQQLRDKIKETMQLLNVR